MGQFFSAVNVTKRNTFLHGTLVGRGSYMNGVSTDKQVFCHIFCE